MSSFEMTRRFHSWMGLPVHDSPREPTIEERILRAKLLFEETMETIGKGLGVTIFCGDGENQLVEITETGLSFEIAGRYDPVETLDGLARGRIAERGD